MACGQATNQGFNFTGHMRRLCADMVARLPELAHIDLDRVAISFSQTRAPGPYGLQATLTPMRFEGGAITGERKGRSYRVQQLRDAEGRELLYILSFYLPRFLDQPLTEKINTVLHELWHISPDFNGDLRRFAGRCFAHGASQKAYNAVVEELAARWWAARPEAELYDSLRHDFRTLSRLYGRVNGLRIPNPKLIPEHS